MFSELGNNWDVKPEVLKQLEHFTCLLYGQGPEYLVDIICAPLLRKMVEEDKKFTSKSKFDLSRLPPCQSALKPHIQRVNHCVALYKQANEAIVEKPKSHD